MSILKKKFFERSTIMIAKELLGKFLVLRRPTSKLRRRTSCFMITEVEAYDGPHDKASHAHRGKTARNEPMFGEAGIWYVYFTYGMHFMLNIVTDKKGYPAAILIRGVEGVNGPGRLTKFLKINKKFNNTPANKKTGLWIEDFGVRLKKSQIKTSPRIGVPYAKEWKDEYFRFYL